MIALIQRVSQASVAVDGETVAAIAVGVLALIAAEPEDDQARAERLAARILNYRVFADASGRMNRSLRDTGHGVLAVPQFTLAADTRRGNRPGFSTACDPGRAQPLFEQLVASLAHRHSPVAHGIFGADMQVALINDGPVTFWLEA